MSGNFKTKFLSNVAFFILTMGVFWIGADLRDFGAGSSVSYNTVASFYFDRSNRLLQDGKFPSIDQWGFAPVRHQENTPPLLAYATVWLYKVFGLFRPVQFEDFVDIFPVLVYGIWFLSIILIFSDLWNRWTGLAMGAVFSFLPVSVELTKKGFYFEELMGNLFLFLSTYFLIKIPLVQTSKQWYWLTGGVVAITGLILSWQQFPIFYGAAILAILFHLKISYTPRHIRNWVLLLGLPLILGHLTANGLVGNDYSPFLMLREGAIGFLQRNDPDLILAMHRGDWADLAWRSFYGYFGWLSVVLIAMGFIAAVFDLRNFTKRTAGIFAVAGLLALSEFIKERFLAMSMSLPLMALGLNVLFAPDYVLSVLRKFMYCFSSLCKIILQNIGSHRHIVVAIVSVAVVGMGSLLFAIGRYPPPPKPVIHLSGLENPIPIGETKKIEIVLENDGGPAFRNKYAFAGLHVEIENAHVRNIESNSKGSQNMIALKDFARSGRFFFFETKFGFLDSGERGRVTFDITPYAKPVRIYYRGWIPGPCSREEQKEIIRDLLPGWQSIDKSGWRNENCIRRAPALTESQEPICRVPVFAAHRTLQDFRCFVAPQEN